MKINVYALHDLATGLFSQPMYFPTDGASIRAFMDAVNDPQNTVHKHADDYTWHQLGYYDDEKGRFTNLEDGPKLIARGKEMRYRAQQRGPIHELTGENDTE